MKKIIICLFLAIITLNQSWANCPEKILALSIEKNTYGLSKHEMMYLKLKQEKIHKRVEKQLIEICQDQKKCELTSAELNEVVEDLVENNILNSINNLRRIKAYSALISMMLGSAMLSSHLIKALPGDLEFLSIFIVHITSLGVYIASAPMLEPLQSKFRRFIFLLEKSRKKSKNQLHQDFEEIWMKTNQELTLNAQMSRNNLEAFIRAAQTNFQNAYGLFKEGDEFAAHQEIALAFRKLIFYYPDLPLESHAIKDEVKSFNHFFETQEQLDASKKAIYQLIIEDADEYPEYQLEIKGRAVLENIKLRKEFK